MPLRKNTLAIGSRASKLALRQAQEVLDALSSRFPATAFAIVGISTQGDKARNIPLGQLGKGVFVKEIEEALLSRRIDLAVHSLKDLPTELPSGLILGAITQREDPRDVLISKNHALLKELPRGAMVGTSSPRRAAQLKAFRPDLALVPLRGNVDTRVRKALEGGLDGVVLAAAGVKRLGLESAIAEYLPSEVCLPAPGQGAIAIEVRAKDKQTLAMVSAINHLPSQQSALAERAFLAALGGGCRVPIGALGKVQGETMELYGMIASEDGSLIYRAHVEGSPEEPEELGRSLFQKLVARGADRLLQDAR